MIERLSAYARDAVSYRYAREAIAISERRFTYTRDAVAYRYAREVGAIIERTCSYASISAS